MLALLYDIHGRRGELRAEPGPDDERLLAGATQRTVVFGHRHLQFRLELRRTAYDAERAAAQVRELLGDFDEQVARRIETGLA